MSTKIFSNTQIQKCSQIYSQIHTNTDEVLSRAALHLQPASDGLNTTCLQCQLNDFNKF